MNSIEQCYAILGVEPGASQAEVKKAYREQAKTWHPDRFPNEPQLRQKAMESCLPAVALTKRLSCGIWKRGGASVI
jgi:curved DNA-binding protein CbpA